jgi:hypothetical protein
MLEAAGCPLTCEEIEEASRGSGKAIRHNNANKVLKMVPELARRLDADDLRVRYEILNPGRAYIRMMNSISTEPVVQKGPKVSKNSPEAPERVAALPDDR